MKFYAACWICIIVIMGCLSVKAGNCPSEDYIWLEYGKRRKENNGSITQQLFIRFGEFPSKQGNADFLQNLSCFYSTETQKDSLYRLDINKGEDGLFCEINVFENPLL